LVDQIENKVGTEGGDIVRRFTATEVGKITDGGYYTFG
jgi:hypothetical protein